MKNANILVVEDEEDIQELIRYNLAKEGYRVTLAATGEEALDSIGKSSPELILLDLMLPGLDGLEVCRQIKGQPAFQNIPIIMVTAKGEESDVVSGLELGADDYVTKPFSLKVLLARIRTVLRRPSKKAKGEEGKAIEMHGLTLDPQRHEVKVDGQAATLTNTEYRILHFLAQRPGWVFTRNQIVDAVRGSHYAVTERSVDVQVAGLRKKLGTFSECIETVRGVGYRMKD